MRKYIRRRFSYLCLVCVIVISLLTCVGCGSSCNNSEDYDGDNVSSPSSASLSGDIAIVISPDIDKNGTTSNSAFPISGTIISTNAEIMPEQVSWTLSTPDTTTAFSSVDNGVFTVSSIGNWTGAINLQLGDNQITLSIQDTESSVDLFVTYNPDYYFDGTLMMTPDVAYVGEDRVITATIYLTDTDTDPTDVKLMKVETTATEVVSMLDDGACATGECLGDASGDEIAGDSVYTGRFTSSETSDTTVVYRVVVGLASSSDSVHSEKFELMTTHHLTDAKLDELLIKQSGFQDQLEIAAEQGGVTEAIEKIIVELENDPEVAQVGINDSGQGIWIIYNDGVGGVLSLPLSDSKGSGQRTLDVPSQSESIEPTSNRLVDYSSYEDYPTIMANKYAQADVRLPNDYVNSIKSNRTHAIAAQYFDWGDDDDIPMMIQQLRNSQRFDIKYTQYHALGAGEVEDFKNLDDYGVILISSHGDSFFKRKARSGKGKLGWNRPGGIVVLNSNMIVTSINKLTYEDDLKKKRLVIWGKTYGITPAFIEKYSDNFPNSLVYMSMCRSTWNTSMADAFLSGGAGAYLGYTLNVKRPSCIKQGPPLLQKLLEPGKTLGDAIEPIQDNIKLGRLTMFGSKSLSLEIKALSKREASLSIDYKGWVLPSNPQNYSAVERAYGVVPLTITSGPSTLGIGDVTATHRTKGGTGRGVAHVIVTNLYDEIVEIEGLDHYFFEIEIRFAIDQANHTLFELYKFTVALNPTNDYKYENDWGTSAQGSSLRVEFVDP
ncbi:MAG: hypothetical protein HQ553_06830 [Chloroflexi bacterium]|nr:hypothetical protein [Chloroflexota bacterium]